MIKEFEDNVEIRGIWTVSYFQNCVYEEDDNANGVKRHQNSHRTSLTSLGCLRLNPRASHRWSHSWNWSGLKRNGNKNSSVKSEIVRFEMRLNFYIITAFEITDLNFFCRRNSGMPHKNTTA